MEIDTEFYTELRDAAGEKNGSGKFATAVVDGDTLPRADHEGRTFADDIPIACLAGVTDGSMPTRRGYT
jgi:hypothetical protein